MRLPRNWGFFWKSKEQSAWLAAWGLSAQVSLEELSNSTLDETLTVCGGFPFAPARQEVNEWQELSEPFWFVPQFIWRQKAAGGQLEINCPIETAPNDDAWKQELIHKADSFLQSLIAASLVPSQPLPAYSERLEFPTRARWNAEMQAAQDSMEQHDFDKVVLSRRLQLRFPDEISAADLMQNLGTLKEESFLFVMQTPSGRCFMGRSPERLLAWQGATFQLDAIAGTRRRSASIPGDQAYSEELQNSPKEQNEHRLVGQAISTLLDAEGISFRVLDEQAIIRLQHVQHMRTRFQGVMPAGRRALELLPLLHPTPAVGGYPRQPAVAFMLREEAYDRGWFTGGIGVFQGSNGDVAIGIRSALVDGSSLWIYAGAGIVPGSIAATEWREIEAKMQNFLGFLQARDASDE